MKKTINPILLLLLFLPLSGFTQILAEYSFTHLNKSTGFPSEYVYSMERDSSGNLWALTEKGLMCYNGHSGHVYGVTGDSRGMMPGRPYNLYSDKFGTLWISYTEAYISCFNPKTEKFTHFIHNANDLSSYPNAMASEFFEDSRGNFWIGTWGGGLCKLDIITKKFQTFLPELENQFSFQSTNAVSITEDWDGSLIIGTWEGDGYSNFLSVLNPETNQFSFFSIEEYTFENEIEQIKIAEAFKIVHFVELDDAKNLWVGTYTGLFYVDRKLKTIERITGLDKDLLNSKGQITFDNVMSCLHQSDDVLWFPTEVSGIMVYDTKTKEVSYIKKELENPSSLSGNVIRDVLKTQYGNIWVATNSGGLDVYSPTDHQFKILSNEKLKAEKMHMAQGLNAINQIAVSNVSPIILIAHGNGATIYHTESGESERLNIRAAYYEALKGNPSLEKFNHNNPNFVGNVFEIGDTYIFATYIGRVLYNTKTKSLDFSQLRLSGGFFPTEYNGESEIFVMIAEPERDNEVGAPNVPYIAKYNTKTLTENKLYKLPLELETGEKSEYTAMERIDSLHFFVRYSENSFLIYNSMWNRCKIYSALAPFESFPDTNQRLLHIDNYGMVWLVAENGLYGFDYKTGQIFNIEPNLNLKADDEIRCLTRDQQGVLWIGLKTDLLRYNPDTKEVFRFTKQHGFDVGGFTSRFLRRHNKEDVIIPANYGLLKFDPKRIIFHTSTPSIFISEIIIGKDTLDPTNKSDFITTKPQLAWNENFITIEFASDLLYSSAGKSYEYRLMGLDSSWSRVLNQNKASYTNLSDGEYEFQVRCIDGYNNMSPTLAFKFVINKPFWWQWWFILLEIFVGLVGIIIYVNQREKSLKRSKLKLEAAVKIRTYEVNEKVQEIEAQKNIIEIKNKELTDSINYAKGIQNTLLANQDLLNKHLPEHMIFFKPKDIVSGDFYWAAKGEDSFYLAICDSTGHGVPGAFMSLLNIRYLNEAIVEKNIQSPNIVFDYVRNKLIENLAFDGTKDGMDGTLVKFDKKSNVVTYSSAQNHPLLIRNGEPKSLPADKMPIGGGYFNDPFQPHQIALQEGDVLYFYTDGYPDQFGGPKGAKLKHANLIKFLLLIHNLPLEEQYYRMDEHLSSWKGELEQLDDILLVAIKAEPHLN